MKLILNEFDRLAAEADDRHQMLINALTQESRQGMVGFHALSPAQARRTKSQMITIAQLALGTEEAQMEVEIKGVTESALRAAYDHLGINDPRNTPIALSEALSASEDASVSYLLGEITSQVNKDVNQTLKDYRNAALRAMMKSQIEGISREKANETVLLEEVNADRKPVFTDRAGRRIKSNLHVRRVWRQALRDHWVQTYLHVLSSYGISEAVLWHPDVTHRYHGAVIKITEPDYGLDDKNRALHPNSRALPVAKSYMEMTV